MTTVNVQFSDASETVIAMYFSGPQSAEDYPHQGEVSASSQMWKTFYDAASGIAQGMPSPTDS